MVREDVIKMCQLIVRMRGEFIEARDNQAEKIMQMVAGKAQVDIDVKESEVVTEVSSGRRLWTVELAGKATSSCAATRRRTSSKSSKRSTARL